MRDASRRSHPRSPRSLQRGPTTANGSRISKRRAKTKPPSRSSTSLGLSRPRRADAVDTSDTRAGFAFPVGSLVCVLLCAASLVAQQRFRASAVLVEVDTIVTDGKGVFVGNLTADDFEVFE